MKKRINLKSRYSPEAGKNYLSLFVPQGMTGAQLEQFAAGKAADLEEAKTKIVNKFYDATGIKTIEVGKEVKNGLNT